jgi:hypothetical protein
MSFEPAAVDTQALGSSRSSTFSPASVDCVQETLSMLWDEVSAIHHPEVNGIAELGSQRIENHLKRSSLVVVEQILDIF